VHDGAHDAFLTATLGLRLVKCTVNQDDPRTPHCFWARYDGQAVPYQVISFPSPDGLLLEIATD